VDAERPAKPGLNAGVTVTGRHTPGSELRRVARADIAAMEAKERQGERDYFPLATTKVERRSFG
jgi:hypothetical protein